jgi:hypothetical protein
MRNMTASALYKYYVNFATIVWLCKVPSLQHDMVLKILHAVGTAILPSEYYTHIVVAIVGIITVYAFAQGRKTSRERNLHGRTILITVAFHFNIVVSLFG